jgi:hypothetical protein
VRPVLLAGLFATLLAAAAGAQDYFQWGRSRTAPPRFPTADSFDGSFNFCRLMFMSDRREPSGSGWSTDYPDADNNFSIRLSELTKTRVSQMPDGKPNHLVVRATDDALFECPFILMEDAGTARFSDDEVTRLRAYLLKGGFLWVDDFWGDRAWHQWQDELARVLPPIEYPVVDLTPDHPMFRMMFTIKSMPQIPAISYWRRSGGGTSERGLETDDVHTAGVSDARGRLMVLITHNTDIADAWEREGEEREYFYRFSPDGYAVGINVVLYSMTH